MTTQLNAVVSSYSPGRSVTVFPAEVELKAPRTTFDVAVLDGTNETAVERQGHGFQRTLLISALQLLAMSGAASAEGVICLAIEEPELFQHPIQAQTFAKVLRSLAEDSGKRIQVTYATHSPYFLEARHFDQVRRLTRSTHDIRQRGADHLSADLERSRHRNRVLLRLRAGHPGRAPRPPPAAMDGAEPGVDHALPQPTRTGAGRARLRRFHEGGEPARVPLARQRVARNGVIAALDRGILTLRRSTAPPRPPCPAASC